MRPLTRWLNSLLGRRRLRGSQDNQFLNAHRRHPVRWS